MDFIAILTFLLGFFSKFIYDYCIEYFRLKRIRAYFHYTIEFLTKHLANQAKYFEAYIKELNGSLSLVKLTSETGFSLENVKVVSKSDLFKIFVDNRKGNLKLKSKAFDKLFNVFESLQFIIDNYSKDHEKYMGEINIHRAEIHDVLILMRDHRINKLITILPDITSTNPYFDLFNKLFVELALKKKISVYDINNLLITPLLEKASENKENSLTSYCLTAKTAYENFETVKNIWIDVFKWYKLELYRSERRINKCMLILDRENGF